MRKASEIIECDKLEFGRMVRFITGHAFLRRHNWIIDPERFSSCRFCGDDEEGETPWHFIAQCPAFIINRRVFTPEGDINVDTLTNPPEWEVYQLREFLSNPRVKELECTEMMDE